MPKGVYYKRSEEGEARRIASMPRGKNHWNFSDNPTIPAIHRWLNRHYGRASKCENQECAGKFIKVDWALIRGKKYGKDRNLFKQLCRSCHVKYDMTDERRMKISLQSIAMWSKRKHEALIPF
jgi:hypothetical protein